MLWIFIIILTYLTIYGSQFSYTNRYHSIKRKIQAIIRKDKLDAENELIEKKIDDMEHTRKVQKRNTAEIGYKDDDVQIIKKTRKREILP